MVFDKLINMFNIRTNEPELLTSFEQYVSEAVGPISFVIHPQDKALHIDVHVIKPSEVRPWFTLVTSGVSDLPMSVPEYSPVSPHVELVMCLPKTWRFDRASMSNPVYSWPIDLLQNLGKMSHLQDTFLAAGHTISNDAPFAMSTELSATLITLPIGYEFEDMFVTEDKRISFLQVLPIYDNELGYIMLHGAHEFWDFICDGYEKTNLSLDSLFEVNRPNALSIGLHPTFDRYSYEVMAMLQKMGDSKAKKDAFNSLGTLNHADQYRVSLENLPRSTV